MAFIITFDLQVGGTLGISGSICHFACHGDSTVVENQGVFSSLLDDINILSKTTKTETSIMWPV